MPDAEDDSALDPARIPANPARRFFVAMLVKDIELVPAILDLVDNSIDGAKRIRPPLDGDDPGLLGVQPDGGEGDVEPMRFDDLFVNIVVDGERFEIEDNCGGMSLEAARSYAFRFGRPETVQGPLGEVGQFGVGMKRALFKLGSHFEITSMSPTDMFTLPVDVPSWMSDPSPEWSFELSNFQEGLEHDLGETGTTIEVTELHDTIAEETGDPAFVGRLRAELRLRHSDAINQGLKLSVNSDTVDSFTPELLQGDHFAPIFVDQAVDAGGERSLRMRLYAGVLRLRDEDRDISDAEDFREPPDAGWYMYCNGRLLLAADRTRLTGWGQPAAAYHPQYRQFRGYVLLDGDSALMPWTTTKTSVDEDARVFRAVQVEMFDALQKTQAVLNRLKKELGSGNENKPAVVAMAAARAVPLGAVEPRSAPAMPPPAPRTPSTTRRIAYDVDKADYDVVVAELGARSAAETGRATFDFFLQNQVTG
jgi:hypothetical protein